MKNIPLITLLILSLTPHIVLAESLPDCAKEFPNANPNSFLKAHKKLWSKGEFDKSRALLKKELAEYTMSSSPSGKPIIVKLGSKKSIKPIRYCGHTRVVEYLDAKEAKHLKKLAKEESYAKHQEKRKREQEASRLARQEYEAELQAAKEEKRIKKQEESRLAMEKAEKERVLRELKEEEARAKEATRKRKIKEITSEKSKLYEKINKKKPVKYMMVASQRLDDGIVIATGDKGMIGIEDNLGIIDKAGVFYVELNKTTKTLSRKLNNGFSQTIPVFRTQTIGQLAFDHWKKSEEYIAIMRKVNELDTEIASLK